MLSVLDFIAGWQRVEAEGGCDARGSAEYRRVRDQWFEAGRPEDVDSFIRTQANLSSAEMKRRQVEGINLDAEVKRLAAEDPEFARFCRFGPKGPA